MPIIDLSNNGLQTHIIDVVRQLRDARETLENDGTSVSPEVDLQFTITAVIPGGINAISRASSSIEQVNVTRVEAVVAKTTRKSAARTAQDENNEQTQESTRKGDQTSTSDENRTTTGKESQVSTEKGTQTSRQDSTSTNDQTSTSTDLADTHTRQNNGGKSEVTTKYDR